jgi:hypothetical protein
MTIEEFMKLKREKMYLRLVQAAPELARGKSRAKKEELVKLYEIFLDQVRLSEEVLAEIITEERQGADPHTAVTNERFEEAELRLNRATETGRLRSDQPNESNRPQADGPALQNTPILTEEAKELRNAFAKETPVVDVDVSPMELRMAAALGLDITMSPEERRVAQAMGLGQVGAQISNSYDREKPYGGGIPKNAAVLRGDEHVVGRRSSRMADSPVGIVVNRKTVVERAMIKLGRDRLQVIANYKGLPANGNRRVRQYRNALYRKIKKFLPKGITLDEAMAVLP